ncbi:leucine-rich repeat-containing protein 56 isoform X4 [Crotalus tigris]|uniref:leucine-rich repeat-containing protein 56 isoform X4 n=1 Tax=Crotalus tigris TaxID=88082 RepID=UPI00192FAF77|nr:leucine-rich repeat-containing protein 56 isoform X4 [Crotalus tigris]
MVDGMTRHSEMKLNWKLDRSSRPGSAAVRVTDLGWQGLLNPNPSVKEDEELLVDEYLSPYKLKALTGLDDLRQVKALEMHVNTRENSLGNFGSYLPNLKQLKLNGSVLTSVRDLGTALPRLQVLWMARCGLPDLDGISACCSLKDPDYNYRIEVKKLIPHLKFLDEIPANQTAIPFPCKMNKDWFIVKESIKEGNLIEEASGSDSQLGFLTRRLGSALRPAATHFLLGSRPQALQRSPSAHLLSGCSTLLESTIYDEILPDDDSSDLTHGVSRVICGNPIKALHARRQKLGSTVTNLFQPPCHLAEHNYDFEETGSVNEKDIFAELKVLQEHHYQHLQALQRAKSPQLLKISHSDEEGEEEEKGCSLSDSFDEDFKEAFQDITQMISSEASCCPHLSQMSSDSSHSLANALPSIVKRSLQPSPPKCPSPASMGVTAGLVRTRHLKIPHSKKAVLKLQPPLVVNRDEVQHMAERTAALNLHRKPDSSSNTAVFTQRQTSCGSKQIRRPFSGPAAFGPTNRATVDRSLPKTISHQIPVTHSYTNMPERFAVLNMVHPLTAKAALQSLSKRPDISMMAQSKTPQL